MRLALAIDLAHDRPEHQVDLASRWAQQTSGSLDLLYVEGTWATTTWIHDEAAQQLVSREVQRMRQASAAHLTDLLARLPEAHRGVARVLEGVAVQALVAASAGYDALLVSTGGSRGLTHFWVGSVAEQLVRRAACPVIVLRRT